jgi:predicted nucleic acid-binding protein
MIVVLDACVLYPAYLRDMLLSAAEADLYDPRWSDDILAEVERNLLADVLTPEQVRHLVSEMCAAFLDALVHDYEALVPAMRNHPKDRHVVAAAVRTRAELIVTDNLRDFRADALEPFGLVAQSADAFLTRLYHINADSVIAVLREQAASYRRPPRTIHDVLDRLAIQAPTFASRVREDLDGEG